MPVKLAKLPWSLSIIEKDGRPTIQLQAWWQDTTKTLESAFATGEANDASIQAAQAQLTAAVADLEQAIEDILTLSGEVAEKQPLNERLTSIGELDSSYGVLVQATATTIAKRGIGTANDTDLIGRSDGDGRYVRQDQAGAPTITAYAGTAISNPPTQAEVQAVDAALVTLRGEVASLVTQLQTVNVLT